MELALHRKQTSEKRKLSSLSAISRVCGNWKNYQEITWGEDPSAASRQTADLRDMGVIVTTKTVRKWRGGTLPTLYAWVLIIKLGWPFLIALFGDVLMQSYKQMEEDHERTRKETEEMDRQITSLMSGHACRGREAVSDPGALNSSSFGCSF